MPIRVVTLFSICILPLIALVGWRIQIDRGTALAQASERAETLALALEHHAARSIEAVELALAAIADDIEFKGFEAASRSPVINNAVAARKQHLPQVLAITVFDQSGKPRIDSSFRGAEDSGSDAEAPMQIAMDNDENVVIGRPFRSKRFDAPVFALSRRVATLEGSGIVMATVNVSHLETLYKNVVSERGARVTLLHRDGTLIARTPTDPTVFGRRFDSDKLFADLLPAAQSGTATVVSPIDGLVRLASYRVVSGQPLVVLVTLSRDDILQPWRARTFETILIVLTLLAFGFAFSLWIDRSLDRRARAEAAAIHSRDLATSAHAAKSNFLASVSHEFRTPLNAILGFSELMQILPTDRTPPSRYREYATLIQRSGQHMLALVNDVLDIAKMDAGKMKLEEEVLDVREVVETSVRLVETHAQEKQLDLSIATPAKPVQMRVDEHKLRQCLLNLLSNAIKFTPDRGKINVAVTVVAQGVQIDVEDTGVGIDAEQLPRLFKPFEQTNSLVARTHDGTGLGVPLTKGLVELHGGCFVLDSEPGRGTVARVILPSERLAA